MLARKYTSRIQQKSVRALANLATAFEEIDTPRYARIAPIVPVTSAKTLDNGINLITRKKTTHMSTMRLMFVNGSRTEGPTERGCAKAVANAMFQGTRWTAGPRFMKEIHDYGYQYKATSNRENISIELKGPAAAWDATLSFITEIVSEPLLPSLPLVDNGLYSNFLAEHWAKQPENAVMELLHEAAYGEGSPYCWDNGIVDTVATTVGFRNRVFNTSDMVIINDGVEDMRRLEEAILKQDFEQSPSAAPPSAAYVGGEVRQREMGPTYLAVGFPISCSKADTILAKLMEQAVKDSLPTKRSGKVLSHVLRYQGQGMFAVQTQTSSELAPGVLQTLVDTLKAVAAETVPAQDIAAVATSVTLENAINAGSMDSMVSSYMHGEQLGSFTDLRQVKMADLKAAAVAALKSTPAYALRGPTHNMPKLSGLQDMLK